MADVYLLEGAVDLSAGASYSTGSLPSGGDNLYIIAGSQHINAGVTALSAIALATVFISSGFAGKLGSAGAPVVFSTITSLEVDAGGGEHYISSSTVTASRVAGTGGGKFYIQGGTHTLLTVFGGDVEVGGAATVTTIQALGGSTYMRTLTSGAATTTALVEQGKLTSERSIATVELADGLANVLLVSAAAVTTKLRLFAGVYTHQSSGTITLLDGVAGTFSSNGAKSKFAITNANLYRRLSIVDGTNLSYITWTNQPKLYGFKGGGALKV